MDNQGYGENNFQSPSFASPQKIFTDEELGLRRSSPRSDTIVDVTAEATMLNLASMPSGTETIEVMTEEGLTKTSINWSALTGQANITARPEKYLAAQKTETETLQLTDEITRLKSELENLKSQIPNTLVPEIQNINVAIADLVQRSNKNFSEEFAISGSGIGLLFEVRSGQASELPGWV